MNQQEELCGTVDRFLFQSADSGYCVFILQHATLSSVVTGYLPSVQPGQQVTLQGTWIMHAKFGKQFQATSCSSQLPTTIVGIQKYLGSGLIKGIGKIYAKKMVDFFGAKILEIIDQTPDNLKKIPGIGPKRIEQIKTAWHDQKEISNIMIFLQDKGISPVFAAKIYKQYGQSSIAVISENPYRLAEDIWGIGFKSADAVAQKLGFEKSSVKRIKAGILYLITQATGSGHLYAELEELKKQLYILLELEQAQSEQTISLALHELYDADKIKLISQDATHFITLSQYYFSEKGVAQKLLALSNYTSSDRFAMKEIYASLRVPDNNNVLLNEDQQHAIMTCLQQNVTIITGGPGTGKTTLIKKMLSLLDHYHMRYRLAAPTGRAAKRMMEGTGKHAVTLHRLLDFDASTMGFKHHEHNALNTDFLIIDEASMIDIFLAHALLKAIKLGTHLILIGDSNQLPSVGAGNVLKDMIKSAQIPCVHLHHIFRQAQDSLIIINAHRINKGEFPVAHTPESKKDFIFIKEENPEQVANYLKKIYANTHKGISITQKNSIVLTPMNRGIVGTITLNHILQTLLNPRSEEHAVRYAGTVFKPGDNVMQIRNNYDKGVFNGDIGTIERLDLEEKKIVVGIDQRIIEYFFDELNELVLAYAISIHKSQGSEYDVVIVPLFMQHFMLLQRNLVYTAITRAKKLCIFIGQPKALAIAIKNNKTIIRKTFLSEFLTNKLQHR